jgi:hypothetical protein
MLQSSKLKSGIGGGSVVVVAAVFVAISRLETGESQASMCLFTLILLHFSVIDCMLHSSYGVKFVLHSVPPYNSCSLHLITKPRAKVFPSAVHVRNVSIGEEVPVESSPSRTDQGAGVATIFSPQSSMAVFFELSRGRPLYLARRTRQCQIRRRRSEEFMMIVDAYYETQSDFMWF